MVLHFQAASLVASPSYPNLVAWSDENLVAVASGHLVTILNPSLLFGPRGLITIPPSKPFPIGVIKRDDLLTGCLLPKCLSRGTRPCARSISWSHLGLAPNSGCLIAVCTTEGRVKLYSPPFCEFSAEWIEVADISDLLFDYLVSINFGEVDMPSTKSFQEPAEEHHKEPGCASDLQNSVSSKRHKRRMGNKIIGTGNLGDQLSCGKSKENGSGGCAPPNEKVVTVRTEVATFPCSIFKKGSSVEVLNQNGTRRVWVSGIIECVDGAKALVLFQETVTNGKQDEWVEINRYSDKIKNSSDLNGSTTHQDTLPKVRPPMDAGNIPEQIFLTECNGMKEILYMGQVVEAWVDNRWVEGIFMGFNKHSLLVKLYGDNGCISLDSRSVRLAPLWNGELKSWQVTLFKIESEDRELPEVVELKSEKFTENNMHQSSSVSKSNGKLLKNRKESGPFPLITAGQYASRSAMLSSLVVVWSPVLQLSSKGNFSSINSSSNKCSLLAVGGKSGKISLWRIHEPECYSVEQSRDSVDVLLVGLLQAHNTWITAINWGIFSSDAPKSQVILATGSSDGRNEELLCVTAPEKPLFQLICSCVKIWLGDTEELVKSSEVNYASFCLLKEVITVTSVPVSVLSLTVPAESLDKMLLAIGKGSGSLEVWSCAISSWKFQTVGSYDAHDQVITGLAWAFDGHCLYSCSQDNYMRSWILHGNSLYEVPVPSNSLGLWSSTDLPHVSDSCFGLAISPGNLVVAVARSFDADLLNPMYQARTQKAAVEFFWIGGQQLEVSSDRYLEYRIDTFHAFSDMELASWESNILWSLKQYDHIDKPLVTWDVVAALSAFKHSVPNYVERILVKWISSWFVGCNMDFSPEKILFHARHFLSEIHSRQMHLLNIICRRLVLSDVKDDMLDSEQLKLGIDGVEDKQLNLWVQLLVSSERELQVRLVAISFAAVLGHASCSATNAPSRTWLPVGVAQMEQWVAINHKWVQDPLKLLASEVKKLGKRLHSICEYVVEEQCRFCSASVPFESPKVAFCDGMKCKSGVGQSHKLARCAVNTQVCPITPLWHCVCCQRWASKLPPQTLFTMSKSSLDLKSLTESPQVSSRPLCPFCGILLQRLQPEFLLSASPV